MGVARKAGGDALLSDELPRARAVDHVQTTVLALTQNLDLTGQEEVHRRRGLTLFDQVRAGGEPFERDEIGGIPERGCLASEDRDRPGEVPCALEAFRQLDHPTGQAVA